MKKSTAKLGGIFVALTAIVLAIIFIPQNRPTTFELLSKNGDLKSAQIESILLFSHMSGKSVELPEGAEIENFIALLKDTKMKSAKSDPTAPGSNIYYATVKYNTGEQTEFALGVIEVDFQFYVPLDDKALIAALEPKFG